MLNLFIGLMIGGCITACCLCLIQLNKIKDYEDKLDKLEEKLSENDNADRY